jgi:hypothetical protein
LEDVNIQYSMLSSTKVRNHGVRFLEGFEIFSLRYSVQTDSGAQPASYPTDTGRFFPRRKSGRGVKVTTHLHLVSKLSVELYLHSPNG